MAEKFWDRHNEQDRATFAQFLHPLVIASRTKTFTKAEASVYLLTLQDVPREIVALGVSRLIERGITWMPKPGDIKAACCDIVDERRAEAVRKAKSLYGHCDACEAGGLPADHCPECHGNGWLDSESGVVRCPHLARELALIAEAGNPLSRPALPASTEVEA